MQAGTTRLMSSSTRAQVQALELHTISASLMDQQSSKPKSHMRSRSPCLQRRLFFRGAPLSPAGGYQAPTAAPTSVRPRFSNVRSKRSAEKPGRSPPQKLLHRIVRLLAGRISVEEPCLPQGHPSGFFRPSHSPTEALRRHVRVPDLEPPVLVVNENVRPKGSLLVQVVHGLGQHRIHPLGVRLRGLDLRRHLLRGRLSGWPPGTGDLWG